MHTFKDFDKLFPGIPIAQGLSLFWQCELIIPTEKKIIGEVNEWWTQSSKSQNKLSPCDLRGDSNDYNCNLIVFVHFRQAQSDVERAREDASIGSKHLEEQMVSFEKRRLHDIKVGIFLRHTLVSPFCQSKIPIIETPDLRYYIWYISCFAFLSDFHVGLF